MIYIQIRDEKNNVLAKPKTMEEAGRLAKQLRLERKETVTIWTTEPVRVSANFWEYGYHNKITYDYEKKYFVSVEGGDWEQIKVETVEQFEKIVNLMKKCNPDKTIVTKIE